MRYVVCVVLLGGCSASALPIGDSDAMSIVWEQTYGMERETRPIVIWHDECRVTDDGAGRERAVTVGDGCVQAEVYSDGRIEIQSAAAISSSAFALALDAWKLRLTTATFEPIDGREVQSAKAALIHAGF